MKVVQVKEEPGKYRFWCPACKCNHYFTDEWTWNKDYDKPTISPSIDSKGYSYGLGRDYHCHIMINGGVIQYLGDCTNDHANESLPMMDITC